MRYLLLLLLAACSSDPAPGPRPNVTAIVTGATLGGNGCVAVWRAYADAHTPVPYYVLMNNTGGVLRSDSGTFVDSITHAYQGGDVRPWSVSWIFFSRSDSLDHASIHADCTAHMCGKLQGSC